MTIAARLSAGAVEAGAGLPNESALAAASAGRKESITSFNWLPTASFANCLVNCPKLTENRVPQWRGNAAYWQRFMERLAVEPTELLRVKDAPAMVPPSAVNGTVSVNAPPLRMESSPRK